MKRLVLWIFLFLSVAIAGYAFLSYAMYAWLGATPNYPVERASYGAGASLATTLVFFLGAMIVAMILWKTRKR